MRCIGWAPGTCLGAGPNSYHEHEAIAGWNRRAAIQQAAVPEGLPQAVLTLNAAWNRKEPEEAIAGHMDLCRRLALAASPAPPKQQDCVSQNAESEAQAILMRADAPQEQPEAPLSMSMFASRADFENAKKQQPALGRGEGGGVPLTEARISEIADCYQTGRAQGDHDFARAIEAAHGIGKAPTGQINPDSAGQGMEGGV